MSAASGGASSVFAPPPPPPPSSASASPHSLLTTLDDHVGLYRLGSYLYLCGCLFFGLDALAQGHRKVVLAHLERAVCGGDSHRSSEQQPTHVSPETDVGRDTPTTTATKTPQTQTLWWFWWVRAAYHAPKYYSLGVVCFTVGTICFVADAERLRRT
ncbi:hypothetical protein RI054_14g70420 [Pseudoscourfieldia marina]